MAAGTPVPYNHARHVIGQGGVNLETATIKQLLVSSAYTPDNDAHQFVSDLTNIVTANLVVARPQIANQTWTKGTSKSRLSSDPTEFVASGGSVVGRRIITFVDTGNDATSLLLSHCLLDSTPADVTALDGEKIRVTPHATEGWVYL
jgi:hypothetical protein